MAIPIDNTYLTNYGLNTQDVSASNLQNTIKSAKNDDETLSACKQFESYLVQQMYKNMEKAAKVLTEDEEDNSSTSYVDTFSDTYLQDIADKMISSGQGLGLAEKLYESITGNSYSSALNAVDMTGSSNE